jgi:hypothetical protein
MNIPRDIVRIIADYVGHDLELQFTLQFYRDHIDKFSCDILASNATIPQSFRTEFMLPCCRNQSEPVCVIDFKKEDSHGLPTNLQSAYLPFFCDFVNEEVINHILNCVDASRIPWNSICSNPKLSVEFYRRHFNKIEWDYLSKNRGSLVELYDQYPERLDWEFICQNPSVPLWFYQKYSSRLNWHAIGRNKSLPRLIMAQEVREYLITHFLKK